MKSAIQLFKLPHYLKNGFVLLPLFFSAHFTNSDLATRALLAFFSFCLMASSVYLFNDIHDAKEDRLHPEKKSRPIASGKVSIATARLLEILFLIVSLGVALLVNLELAAVVVFYKVINILYTLSLKKIAIIDVMILSVGFVLRLFAGSVSTGTELSVWIIIITFLLSLLISLGKRRIDVIYYEQNQVMLRKAVSGYNSRFLDYAMVMLSSVIIVAYIMYTVSPENIARVNSTYLFMTVFWVIGGILRYLQLLFVEKSLLSPVQILVKDAPLKFVLVAWILNFVYLIYLH